RVGKRQLMSISAGVLAVLQQFAELTHEATPAIPPAIRGELRGVMNHYLTHMLGHKPKMHEYLGTITSS
ncbi:MAG: hypothetical protein SGJ20_12960, partial [Planctomycetota bacterium]|nr:hypothetical protein [Planctomycetota bacterium]